MPAVSILIPTRNRSGLLALTLKSIRVRGYHDTEVVVLDDGSTDNTREVLAREGWVRSGFIDREGGYRNDPAPVYNHLMAMGQGDVLIQQSAEVVHLTPVARQLHEACESGVVVFATVLCGSLRDLPTVNRAVAAGWAGQATEWDGMNRSYIDPDGRRPDGGQGTAIPPVVLRVGGALVDIYTSAERPVPFFFCGAITRGDWERTGGYPEDVPHGASDLHLAVKMMRMGMRFRFLGGAVAYHIAHDKT